jgi:mannose-6-phosphate isomerase-like protein (cupin superfamily)
VDARRAVAALLEVIPVPTPPTFDPSGFSTAPGSKRITKPWGYEVLLTPEDAPYAAKLIHVEAGKRLSLQVHDQKVETQTLLDGKGFLVMEDADGQLLDVQLEPGVGYHIAIGQRHRLCAAPDADVTVFEASTPEIGTTYRLEDDFNRPDETETVRANDRSGA